MLITFSQLLGKLLFLAYRLMVLKIVIRVNDYDLCLKTCH